ALINPADNHELVRNERAHLPALRDDL
ncbi:MAG: hypothetical protein RLY19_171, partial [Actinomycetota bacterium]